MRRTLWSYARTKRSKASSSPFWAARMRPASSKGAANLALTVSAASCIGSALMDAAAAKTSRPTCQNDAMARKLAFIHTGHVLIPLFSQLAQQHLNGIETFHMLDESLIRNTIAAGRLTKNTIHRVAKTIESAHEGGADAVLVTCSSIGK